MIKFLRFKIGGYFCGHDEVRLWIYKHSAKYEVLSLNFGRIEDRGFYEKRRFPVNNPDILSEWDALGINSWADEYYEPVLDGLQWELTYREEGRKKRFIFGSNGYPPQWQQFIMWLDALMPEIQFAEYIKKENDINVDESGKALLLQMGNYASIKRNEKGQYVPMTREELRELTGDLSISLGDIDTSRITNMSGLFQFTRRTDFSGIETWDVSHVTDMSEMFNGARSFNGVISRWDVSGVTDMAWMFWDADSFNGDLSGWDVSNVKDMSYMFRGAFHFNGDLSRWDVSNVTNMNLMFQNAWAFNGDIGRWDVSNIISMACLFQGAESFNADISGWDVSNVRIMSEMFLGAKAFDADISGWDVSKVDDMKAMFLGAGAFNSDIGCWDVSSVTDMHEMFQGAKSFNGDIGDWDVSSVTDMSGMFQWAESFNCDISGWRVSNVTDMREMFSGATSYQGNPCDWGNIQPSALQQALASLGDGKRVMEIDPFLGERTMEIRENSRLALTMKWARTHYSIEEGWTIEERVASDEDVIQLISMAFEQFDHNTVQQAIEHCKVDWNRVTKEEMRSMNENVFSFEDTLYNDEASSLAVLQLQCQQRTHRFTQCQRSGRLTSTRDTSTRTCLKGSWYG